MNIAARAFLALALCAFALTSYAQEATPVLRYKAVIDNLRNKNSTNAELDRITTRLLPLAASGADTSAWTNAQKANALLDYIRINVRNRLQEAATTQEGQAVQGTVSTNVAAALNDIN